MVKLLFEEYDFQNRWLRILTHPILLSLFNSILILIIIIFGVVIAARDSNVFVGLLGDGWGEVAIIEEIRTGSYYPFQDPANAEITEPILHQPPLFFWSCMIIGKVCGIPSFWTQHIMNLVARFLRHYTFYILCLALFKNKKHARIALFFSVFAYSLSWIRIAGIVLLNGKTVQTGLMSIITGNTSLNVEPIVKDQINFAMYEYWDLRHNMLTQRNGSLAYGFVFLSILFYTRTKKLTDWKHLGVSAGFFGLAIITHHLITLAFSSIFFILFIIRLIKNRKMTIELPILLIGHLIGAFVTIPVILNLLSGGSTQWILATQTTSTSWGLRNPSGRPSWPYPWEILEAYGLIFPLAILGIYWQYKKGTLDKFSVPSVIVFWGMIIGNLQWVGIEYQVLVRQQEVLFFAFFMYAPFALEYIFLKMDLISSNQKIRYIDLLKRLKLTRFQARALFALMLLIGLFTSQLIGFFIFNLRKTPIHFIVDGDEYEGIMWLAENTQNSEVVYGPEDVSQKIPALSGNKVALGYVSYYSLTREDERALRINESLVVFGKGNYQESEEIIKKYNSSFLFVVLNELPDDKLSFFEGRFEKAFENKDIMIFRVT
ncbi:MAG: hypothetical protein ACFFCD_09330 [Promethearchaeota archaeon]